ALHLLQGPITVFDNGAYAGDARIQDLQPGTERLISYAMDLATEVAPESKSSPQQLLTVKITKGVLYRTDNYARSTTYTVKNSGEKAKNVLVEYPHDPNWNLIAPKDPAETTRDMYRFAVAAEPGKPAKLAVEEERTVGTQIAVTNLDSNAIVIYLNASQVSDAVKEALREVVRRKQQLSVLAAERAEYERQLNVIREQQNRIRENLKVLPKDSELARTYIKKFSEQEEQNDKLQSQIDETVKKENDARRELDEFLLKLDVA
ncbi:MAG: hypothetical protein DCC68_16240, partial [Planctomycetota bacterium]